MNKYIKQLVKEQFNISDIDFSSDENEYGANIFSKYVIDPNDIFTKMINRKAVSTNDIKELNNLVSAVKLKNKNELKRVVHYYSKYCPQDSLNWIDVSGITNMCKLFNSNDRYTNNCECDISQWDVSNVTDMSYMFSGWAENSNIFNNDISQWDVSNVTNMACMFENSIFNMDLSGWDVSNVTDMCSMFDHSEFNKNISQWDVSHVTDMSCMFSFSEFNQDISSWDVSNVTDMSYMFEYSKFKNDISKWNVSKVRHFESIFYECNIIKKYKPRKFR